MNELHSVKKTLKTPLGTFTIFHLGSLMKTGVQTAPNLPYSIKILLENALRNCDGKNVTLNDVKKIAAWSAKNLQPTEMAFYPGRVLLQDFTGVPCVVDLAAMRSAMKRLGGDINKINPLVPCDLVIDHSIQIDASGSKDAFDINIQKEFERNTERYKFLKWGQKSFHNFSVVPPGTGIIHQINLEYLAKGILTKRPQAKQNAVVGSLQSAVSEVVIFPDSLVGTDSHTTMINSLGIAGWGVGGIEAEAVMLGEPITMLLPEVVGFKLTGKLKPGVTSTDLVLTIVEILRKKGVVGKFVEYFGDGYEHLSLPDRAVVANMAPEYGATMGYMPVDEETIRYYRMTGRDPKLVESIAAYYKEQNLFYNPDNIIRYTDTVELNLAHVGPSLAGPKRPQDRVSLEAMKSSFRKSLTAPIKERGFGLNPSDLNKRVETDTGTISHGAVVIASITSCTNTSNPALLIAAGLLARNAVAKGLTVPSHVKTSFAPGSQVTEDYLEAGGISKSLDALGFHIVGYGCATCIGNSGPLPPRVAKAVKDNDLIAASVLSGNRNFEGRINPLTKANFLASPPLVVAYALAGKIDIDLNSEPLGKSRDGAQVFLKDIWPKQKEIDDFVAQHVTAEAFKKCYQDVNKGNTLWNAIHADESPLFDWDEKSTYIQEPPFFADMKKQPGLIQPIRGARCLVMVGDSITTDHISPAGAIAKESPAGKYLMSLGVKPEQFNSYGSRRGNDHVMTRGTFANIRLRNLLAPGTEGSWATHFPDGEKLSIYDTSLKYKEDGVPLVVLAGKEYGTGSSRDWAAKGTALLGVKVVLAQSYERIHRSNLAGMGILPLQFKDGESYESLGLKGNEMFDFAGVNEQLKPRQDIVVTATSPDRKTKEFLTTVRLDTPVEIDYFRNGGILQAVLRKRLQTTD